MHELSIARNIVSIAVEHARGKPIQSITVEIGKLSAILPEALNFCFPICAEKTIAKNAVLHIIETVGKARCHQCTNVFIIENLYDKCSYCHSYDFDCLEGQEMKIKQMEVD